MSPRGPDLRGRVSLARSAPIFAALGDETRLRLVSRMTAGPLSITRLTAHAGMTRQAVTKHLGVLAGVGLVRGSRHGRERLWELEPAGLRRARQALDAIALQWDRSLGRLKDMVEGG